MGWGVFIVSNLAGHKYNFPDFQLFLDESPFWNALVRPLPSVVPRVESKGFRFLHPPDPLIISAVPPRFTEAARSQPSAGGIHA